MATEEKAPKEFYEKIGDKWKCKFCDYTGERGNVIRHLSKHKNLKISRKVYHKEEKPDSEVLTGDSIFTHSTEGGEQIPIPQSTITILSWSKKHNIPLAAIEDKTFVNHIAAHPEGIKSTKTMRTYEAEIAEQIISKKKYALKNEIICLIVDGGTINSYGYYALGCSRNNPSGKGLKSDFIDAIICTEKATTSNILNMIEEKIKSFNSENLVIAGICSDSASNISKGFINTHKERNAESTEVDNIRLPYLRIACSVHTLNLILNDLINNNVTLKIVIKELKEISNSINHMKQATKYKLGLTGFPGIQQQRWNSLCGLFQFVFLDHDKIIQAFPTFSITKEIAEKYKRLLEPHARAVTVLESNYSNQVDVYRELRTLKNEWIKLSENETFQEEAKYLLKSYDERTLYTMDIRISMLAYYLTKGGIYEWRKNFVTKLEAREKRKEYLALLETTADNLASIWRLKPISAGLQYYLETVEFREKSYQLPKFKDLYNSSLQIYDSDYCENFVEFIQRLEVLPASEAFAERMFASMRDLVATNQKSKNPETIRNEIIIKLSHLDPQKTVAKRGSLFTSYIEAGLESSSNDEDYMDEL